MMFLFWDKWIETGTDLQFCIQGRNTYCVTKKSGGNVIDETRGVFPFFRRSNSFLETGFNYCRRVRSE